MLSVFMSPKVLVIVGLAVLGAVLLGFRKLNTKIRVAMLLAAFALFALPTIEAIGVPFAMHPSPLCATTKPLAFYWYKGFIPTGMLAIVIVLLVLSLVGNKLFCGFACPLGAVQELIHLIPLPKAARRLRDYPIPFWLANSIRLGLVEAYVIAFFGLDMIIYEYLNGFHLFHWELTLVGFLPGAIALVASLFWWRPFCLIVCPLGFLSWLGERIAPLRVRANADLCNECGLCETDVPCQAAVQMRDGESCGEDCFNCGQCIEVCDAGVYSFGLPRRKR